MYYFFKTINLIFQEYLFVTLMLMIGDTFVTSFRPISKTKVTRIFRPGEKSKQINIANYSFKEYSEYCVLVAGERYEAVTPSHKYCHLFTEL